MVEAPFPAETRRRLRENDQRWATKVILRLLCTLFAFIALILCARAVALTANEDNSSRALGGDSDWIFWWPVLLSLIYCPLVLALVIFVRCGRAIHPGWDTAADVSVFILGSISVMLLSIDGWFHIRQSSSPIIDNGKETWPCISSDGYSESCAPKFRTAGTLQIAGIVFLVLLTILHFILFVFDCMAVSVYHHNTRKARLADRHIQLQYNRSPEDHTADNRGFGDEIASLPPMYEPPEPNSDVILPTDVKAVPGATKYA